MIFGSVVVLPVYGFSQTYFKMVANLNGYVLIMMMMMVTFDIKIEKICWHNLNQIFITNVSVIKVKINAMMVSKREINNGLKTLVIMKDQYQKMFMNMLITMLE